MIKGILERDGNYNIAYTEALRGNENKIVIVIHGFGSSKESPTAKMMLEGLPEKGIGAVAFDFPAHGLSPVDGDEMTVEGCVEDLNAVEDMIRSKCPFADISYFGSSYGAYIALNHIVKNNIKDAKLFCRSGAVNMPDIFRNPDSKQKADFDENGYTILDYDVARPLKVTTDFVESLMRNDLFEIFEKNDADILMIHGDCDEDVSYERVVEFTEKFDIPLITVKNGDHRLSIPGAPEKVFEEAVKFILK